MLLSQYRQWHNNLSKPVFGRKTNQLYPSMPLDDGLYCEASSKEHFAEDKSPVDVHVRTMPAEEGGGRSPIGRSKEHIKLVDSRGTEAQPTTYEAGFPVSSYPGAQATKSPPLRLS